jgi:hypothetical protein
VRQISLAKHAKHAKKILAHMNQIEDSGRIYGLTGYSLGFPFLKKKSLPNPAMAEDFDA